MNHKVTPDNLDFWINYLAQWDIKISELETSISDPRLEKKSTDLFRKFFSDDQLFRAFVYPGTACAEFNTTNLVMGTHGFHFLRLLTCVNFLKQYTSDTQYEHISCYFQNGKLTPAVGQTRVIFWDLINYTGKILAYVTSDKKHKQKDFQPVSLRTILQDQYIWIQNDNDFDGVVPYCYDRNRDLDQWETQKLEIFSEINDFFAHNKIYFDTDVTDSLPCLTPFLADNPDDASVIINVYNMDKIQDCMLFVFAKKNYSRDDFKVLIKNNL